MLNRLIEEKQFRTDKKAKSIKYMVYFRLSPAIEIDQNKR